MDPLTIVAVVLVTATGACLQGAIGFGLGLVAAPALALIDHDFVPGPVLAVGIPLALSVLLRERQVLDVRAMRWALSGRLAGTVVAAGTMAIVSETALGLLFGVTVLVAVLLSAAGWSVTPTDPTLFTAGAASGFMGTASGIGGPPIALVFQKSRGAELRVTVGVVLAFGAVLSLTSLIVIGRYRAEELGLTMLLVPGTALGFLISGPLRVVLDRGWVRPAVLTFAAASASVLIIRQFV